MMQLHKTRSIKTQPPTYSFDLVTLKEINFHLTINNMDNVHSYANAKFYQHHTCYSA